MNSAMNKILIVEDEAPIREMLAFVLEQNGYEALEAKNFEQAQSLLVEPYPVLILLDWMLPGASGIQIAKQLKRSVVGDESLSIATCGPYQCQKANNCGGSEVVHRHTGHTRKGHSRQEPA